MPKAHRWLDECGCEIDVRIRNKRVLLDIDGNEFECTKDDARDIGQTLIALADEIEAAAE